MRDSSIRIERTGSGNIFSAHIEESGAHSRMGHIRFFAICGNTSGCSSSM